MQSTTAAFNTEKARDPNEPVLLLDLQLTGETLYLSNRAVTVSGQAYTELIKDGIECELSGGFEAEGSGQPKIGNVRITLANEDDVTGTPFSDKLATRTFTNRRAILRQCYIKADGNPLALADCLPLIDGTIRLPEANLFTDQACTLEIIDGSYQWHKSIGTPIALTEFPTAPPQAIGKIKPIIYGSVEHSPAIPVDIGARSTLAADLTASATTIQLTDASQFPSSGTVKIDQEQMTYTGKSGNSLTGAVRGSSSASHDRGATAVEVQSAYEWLVADHPVKTIYPVYMRRQGGSHDDWVRLDPTEYTAYPQGSGGLQKAFIRLAAIPLLKKAIDLAASSPTHAHTDPAHGHTDPSHSHGNDTHTHTDPSHGHGNNSHAHSDPSHAHTDPAHPHSAAGSHTHTETGAKNQLPNAEGFPQTLGGSGQVVGHQYNFSAVANPQSARWHVRRTGTMVTPSGSTWQYVIGGYVRGSWTYPNVPPEDWYYSGDATSSSLTIQNATIGAEITVGIVERDIEYQPDTGASTANVNSNTITIDGTTITIDGTTITVNGTVISIDGTTITVNGTVISIDGTVVSIDGTAVAVLLSGQEIADTLADLEFSADVEGYQDDAVGTYTGVDNGLIYRPADILRHIGAVLLGWTLADRFEAASFAQARNDEAAAGIRLDFALTREMESLELFETIREQSMSAHLLSADGKYKRFVYPFSASILAALAETEDILAPIRVGLTPLGDIVNTVGIRYQPDPSGSDWWGYLERIDAASKGTGNPPTPGYHVDKRLVRDFWMLRDGPAAGKVADNWLAWLKDQRYVCEFPLRPEWIHLEPWDHLGITSARMPGDWSNKEFIVLDIRKQLGDAEEADTIVVTARAAGV